MVRKIKYQMCNKIDNCDNYPRKCKDCRHNPMPDYFAPKDDMEAEITYTVGKI